MEIRACVLVYIIHLTSPSTSLTRSITEADSEDQKFRELETHLEWGVIQFPSIHPSIKKKKKMHICDSFQERDSRENSPSLSGFEVGGVLDEGNQDIL